MIKSHFLLKKLCTVNHENENRKSYTILALVIIYVVYRKIDL